MLQYIDQINSINFPFERRNCRCVEFDKFQLFVKMNDGSRFKVIDVPESITNSEFETLVCAIDRKIDDISKL